MKEEYEKQIRDLTSAKQDSDNELKEKGVLLQKAETLSKEQAVKMTQLTKQIDTLQKELQKVQKGFETQIA